MNNINTINPQSEANIYVNGSCGERPSKTESSPYELYVDDELWARSSMRGAQRAHISHKKYIENLSQLSYIRCIISFIYIKSNSSNKAMHSEKNFMRAYCGDKLLALTHPGDVVIK